jgi:Major Facilitator Superfamily
MATPGTSRPLWPAYAVESLTSISTTLLTIGIFFFTEHYFHWGLRQNLLLAAGQGFAYVIGSLASQHLAARFGRRRALVGVLIILAVIPIVAMKASSPTILIATLVSYMFFAALVWPALESLVCSDADAHAMSHRVTVYNLIWSGANAVTLAASGRVIESWRDGLFVIPAIAHVIAAAMLWAVPAIDPPGGPAATPATAHEPPEPRLLAQRTLALWLARIALPATYVVVYSLSAMLPMLAVLQPLGTAARTAVASIWMIARLLAFVALGAAAWWHTRPRILLVSAAVMLVAFWGVTLRASENDAVALAVMIGSQIVLGVVIGIIYAGSLYFGMVLSDGSTEHGGYHEALIGAGSVIGPGTAALTQWRWPGDLTAGVAAVSGVIALSILAAAIATIRAAKSPT